MDLTSAELAELYLRLGKRIRMLSAKRLAPLGLTPSQGRALRTIAHSDHPLRIVALAERLGIVPRSATAVVDDLERAGLVTRHPDPTDRRSVLVQLSPEGDARITAMHQSRQQAAEDLFTLLTRQDRAKLAEILHILDQAAQDQLSDQNLNRAKR
jgi:DNA-binding MarR family transcriptional regulator